MLNRRGASSRVSMWIVVALVVVVVAVLFLWQRDRESADVDIDIGHNDVELVDVRGTVGRAA